MCCGNPTFRSLLLIAVILFTAINTSRAQHYYNIPGDTLTGTAGFNDISVFNITQVHPTADTLYFKWYQQSVSMPSGWEASICDNGNCYTSLKDSGMMAPIVPGDNGLMSLHLDPGLTPGTGIIRYVLFADNTAQQPDTLTWIITAGTTNGITTQQETLPVVACGNKQIYCSNLKGQFALALLYTANGSLLRRQKITGSETRILMETYPAGIYILKLSGKRNFITKILNQ